MLYMATVVTAAGCDEGVMGRRQSCVIADVIVVVLRQQ